MNNYTLHLRLPDGTRVIASPYVSDIKQRSWRERLFTFPWRPLAKTKPMPVAYFSSLGTIYVSYRTFTRIENELRETNAD